MPKTRKKRSAPKAIPHRREASQLLERWRRRLLLNEYSFDITWMSKEHEDRACMCDIQVDSVYKSANIRIYPGWAKSSRDDRERFLVHELCHCITQGLANRGQDLLNGKLVTQKHLDNEVETATQRIANAVFCRLPKP